MKHLGGRGGHLFRKVDHYQLLAARPCINMSKDGCLIVLAVSLFTPEVF